MVRAPGREYPFQRSTDMVNWTPIATSIAGLVDRTVSYDDMTLPASAFYRAVAQ